ncbi:hypothetical protein FNV43_RR08265 [Rhamnella rubrinervis]|uniref:Uncharacterized protein n=1 Tax=Rhamnella rubrinervis TaxID=2594499 RepID=A0A8K0MN40_9ROSA|nr:hypothetical protein FNV43_RR08265 [Rhamnella rubrinervis]
MDFESGIELWLIRRYLTIHSFSGIAVHETWHGTSVGGGSLTSERKLDLLDSAVRVSLSYGESHWFKSNSRIDSEIEETLRIFCRDKDLQKDSTVQTETLLSMWLYSKRAIYDLPIFQLNRGPKGRERLQKDASISRLIQCLVDAIYELKIVIIWYESPGCADMVAIQSSGSMVADMITALTHTIVKHRKMEPLNVDVWKMRMQLLLKEQDLLKNEKKKRSPQIWR